jgi:Fe(3+) dicitrate transport protein
LLDGEFRNLGNETRILHRYNFLNNISSFLGGIRLYSGNSDQTYGIAPAGKKDDFIYKNPDSLNYDYKNSGKNLALFAENMFMVNDRLTIIPGIRYENISTASDGYFHKPVPTDLAGNPLYPDSTDFREYSNISNTRDFFLMGLGISFKPGENIEVYGNFSQNYKSVSYNDIRVTTPTLEVDRDITDEKGYSLDLGIRGNGSSQFTYEITAFMLMYKDRIGSILMRDPSFRVYRYQTNLGDARNLGIESFFETDILKLFDSGAGETSLNWFMNLTLLHTKYLLGEPSVKGNKVEFSPAVNMRSGLTFRWKKLGISSQISYLSDQFSDASNAPNDPPVPGAVEGMIPAYYVADLTANYRILKWLDVEGSINNLTGNLYFTRRATGYPGPGIIPSDGRTFYLTLTGRL